MLGGSFAGINPLHHLFPGDRERASPYQPSDRRFIDPIYIDLGGVDRFCSRRGCARHWRKAEAAVAALRALRHVDYPAVWEVKRDALSAAFADFRRAWRAAKASRHGIRRLQAGRWRQPSAPWSLRVRRRRRPAAPQRTRRRISTSGCNGSPSGSLPRRLNRARAAGLELGIYRDLALGAARDSGEDPASPDQYAAGVSLGAPPDPFRAGWTGMAAGAVRASRACRCSGLVRSSPSCAQICAMPACCASITFSATCGSSGCPMARRARTVPM